MNLNIAICEDEILVANMLSEYLQELGHEVCLLSLEPNEFLEKVSAKSPDLAFLDVNLNSEMTGIDVAEKLGLFNIPCIFVTAYSDSSTLNSALNQKPLAYLVKPFTKAQLKAQLELIKTQLDQKYVEIHVQNNVYRIIVRDLIYLESDRNYTIFHFINQQIRIRGTLKNFSELFNPNLFISTHRSFVINKDHLITYHKDKCVMTGQLEVPVGRRHRGELDAILL